MPCCTFAATALPTCFPPGFPVFLSLFLFTTYNTTIIGGWGFSHAWTGDVLHRECQCVTTPHASSQSAFAHPTDSSFWLLFLLCVDARPLYIVFHMGVLYNNLFSWNYNEQRTVFVEMPLISSGDWDLMIMLLHNNNKKKKIPAKRFKVLYMLEHSCFHFICEYLHVCLWDVIKCAAWYCGIFNMLSTTLRQ